MDHATRLREEAESPHAQFHQYVLLISKGQPDDQYFFFEGDDDPIFYGDQAQSFLGERLYHDFICRGREEVLKAHDLVARDGRAIDRTHFFVDKDHNDIMGGRTNFSASIFQTCFYSFENYLVCERVLRRFWVERLHLSSSDERLEHTIDTFRVMHLSLMKRMRVLMALVLIGRGIEGRASLKLNLNNVCLDKVLRLDFSRRRINWQPNAIQNFLSASNMIQAAVGPIKNSDIRRICRTYLASTDAKHYVRGKFELWFFVKFLMFKTGELAERKSALALGVARAKPNEAITHTNCVIYLASLCPCPKDLTKYFLERLGSPQL